MKKEFLLALIIPVCLIVYTVQLKNNKGPYYLNQVYDPCYFYLMNSLNLAQMKGYGVGHVDNPGTPVQVLGAVVMKIYFELNSNSDDIIQDVIDRPEIYLNAIEMTMLFLNSAALFILGMIVFNLTKNILYAMFVQLTPFVSVTILNCLTEVKPENLVILFILILLSLFFKYCNAENLKFKTILAYALAFGFLCGAGIATKLNFIPVTVIPFILLKGIKNKIIFLVTVFISFVICISPAISNLDYFLGWMSGLLLHGGQYGRGESTIVNSSTIMLHIYKIFSRELFFSFLYLIILLTVVFIIIKRRKHKNFIDKNSNEPRFLLAVFAAINLQILFVIKMYSQHYMLPALMLMITGIYLCSKLISERFIKFPLSKNALAMLFPAALIVCIITGYRGLNLYKEKGDGAKKIISTINENYPDAVIIPSSKTSSEYVALIYGIFYTGKVAEIYESYADKRFPEQIFYNTWADKFYSSDKTLDIGEKIRNSKKVIFLSKNEGSNKNFTDNLDKNYNIKNASLKKIYTTVDGESLYELDYKNY